MIFEIEYEPWKVLGDKGLWLPSDFLLVGTNVHGDHVRVRYFPGVAAPEPAPAPEPPVPAPAPEPPAVA